MANNKTSNKAVKAAKKAAKKNPKVFWTVVAIILVLAIIGAVVYYFFFYEEKEPIETGELSIHFLELGNGYAGDCTLIKIGDTEVLIDAGSKQQSAETIVPYIKNYCTDGILEYVIATHAHEDHIGAFYSTSTRKGVFESFECKTVIDFPRTNKENPSASSVLGKYIAARDAEMESTEGAVHYTALECWEETNGARRSYELAEGVTLSILYQKYYSETDASGKKITTSGENNFSVCVLITQGENHYLFTGDLEEDGEKSLVAENDLPHCKLYKAGHHGSKTSSHDVLLSVIRPEYVCVCCCAGSPEYTVESDNTFPTQAFIDRVAKYTKNIYVTTLATNVNWETEKWEYTSMNGNIVVMSDGINFFIAGSNNSTILKDTEWFKANRTWPSYGIQ